MPLLPGKPPGIGDPQSIASQASGPVGINSFPLPESNTPSTFINPNTNRGRGLVSRKTNFRSLKYRKDRPGGGDSREPYIQSTLNPDFRDSKNTINRGLDSNPQLGTSPDSIIRGGLGSLRKSIADVSRLTQMFFDFRSPRGLLFLAKQNILSISNVKSDTGNFIGNEDNIDTEGEQGKGLFNKIKNFADKIEGSINSFLPFNQGVYTPLSTLISAAGNPIGLHPNKQGLNPLLFNSDPSFSYKTAVGLGKGPKNHNRNGDQIKSRLWGFVKDFKLTGDGTLIEYKGGPGSTLGIGKTSINILNDQRTQLFKGKAYDSDTLIGGVRFPNSYSLPYAELLFKGNQNKIKLNPTVLDDFRNLTGRSKSSYTAYNHEFRINLGEPGKKRNEYNWTDQTSLDKINAFPLYKSGYVYNRGRREVLDFVKFRIRVINNDNPNLYEWIHFRATNIKMSENYSAEWDPHKFIGRGENFYRYKGFDRKISLSWTVAAQSRGELIPMYQKLNFLASTLAPDFSDLGYMRGNLHKLDLGGYWYAQPGIITSLNYDVPEESPWDITLNNEGGIDSIEERKEFREVKELPHMINVQMNFIPIHDFVPKKQINNYGNAVTYVDSTKKENRTRYFIDKYGKEKYIALRAGGDDSYNYINQSPTSYTPQRV